MKKATKAFPIDNGTVAEGQVLPDSHPAVVRFPENFTDVLETSDDDAAVQSAEAPDGLSTDGTGNTTVVDGPVAGSEPVADPAEAAEPAAEPDAVLPPSS